MIGRDQRARCCEQCAERVKPGVQFECAFVRLSNCKCKGVIKWLRRTAHCPSQVFRPRLEARRVERIARGPCLQDYRMELDRSGTVHDRHKLGLLRGRA